MEMAPSPVQAVPSPSCVSESEVHASFGTTDFNTISKDYSESMDVSRDHLNESAESIAVENDAGSSSPPSSSAATDTAAITSSSTPIHLIPSLKGTMTYAGGIVYCKGRWAMTDAAHDLEGQSSEFEFKLIKADDGSNLFPVNGKYQGWFLIKQPPPAKPIKIEDKEMMMKFTPIDEAEGVFDIVGRGHNKLGKFNLRGKLTSGTGHIHIYREYYELAPLPVAAPKVRVREPKSEKKDVAPKTPAAPSSSAVAPAIAPPSIKPEAPAVTPREGAGRIRKQSSLFKEFHDPLQKISHTPKSQVASKEKETKQAAPIVAATASVPHYPTVTSERTHRLNPAMKKCSDLLKELSKLHQAEWFLEPVDPIKFNIPDYPKIIKQPMDFSTIRKNIEAGAYDSINAFAEHVRLVFRNAITFNPARDSLVNIAAREVSNKFEDKFRLLVTQLDPTSLAAPELTRVSSTSSVGKATGIKRMKSKDYSGPAPRLGRVSSAPGPRPAVNQFIPAAMDTSSLKIMEMQQMMQQMQEELYQLRASVRESEISKKLLETKDAAQNPLTFEEKKVLVGQIHKLPPEKMEEVLQIIQEAVPCGDGEVEVPIDALDTLTLRKLQKFIAENVVPEKKKRVSLSRMSSVDRDQPPVKRPRKPRTPKTNDGGMANIGLSTDFQDDTDLGLFDNNDDLLFETGSLDDMEGNNVGEDTLVQDSVIAAASHDVRVDDYTSEMMAEYEASLKANNNVLVGLKIDDNAWLNNSNGHDGSHHVDEDEDDENLWTEAAAEMQATKKARYDNSSFEV